MSVLLFTSMETETRARITGVHYYPSQLSEEEINKGIIVDTFNEPPLVNGKTGISYIDPQTKVITHEYIDSGNDQEQIEEIRLENENLKQAVADLTVTLAAIVAG